MAQALRAAVCISTRGDALQRFQRCLSSVLEFAPPEKTEIRLGFVQAPHSLHCALGVLCPDASTPTCYLLPGGIERFHWTSTQGSSVWAWHAPTALSDGQLAQMLNHDVPLETDYALRLADESLLENGWWQAIEPLLDQGLDYLGRSIWQDYSPQDVEKIQSYPWYMGVPFARREGARAFPSWRTDSWS